MSDDRIKVLVHHTGHFVILDNGNLLFDGEITEWSVDPDLWSYFGILASVKELGHMDIKEMWYSLGGASVVPDRLELLTDDRGATHVLNIARLNDVVHLYVVHKTTEPDIIEMIDWVDGEVEAEVETEMKEVEGEVGTEMKEVEAEVGTEMKEVVVEGDGHEVGKGDVDANEVGKGLDEGHVEDEVVTQLEEVQGEVQVDREMEETVGEVEAEVDGEQVQCEGVNEGEVHHTHEAEVHDVVDFELHDVHEDDDEDEVGEDGDDHGGEDAGDESISEESDGLVDVRVDCDMGSFKGQPSSPQGASSPQGECLSDSEVEVVDVRGLSDIEWVSDKLDSGPDSEDDDATIPKTLFPTFTMPKSLGEYKWEVGTYFTNKKEFTDAIRTYALSNGKNLKLIKNDKKRVAVKCLGANGKCNWYAYCAYMCLQKSWQLRKIIDDHTCSRDFNVKLITTKWLSEKMEKTVRENPNMKVMDIREKLSRKWNVSISKNMAFRARMMAKYSVEGSFKEQFRRLHDYGHEVLKRNPGSTVQIKVENINEECIFKRIYICLNACKQSFISCRPIIGLDRCFLKGKYGGELLTAVGRDGNEQILPIAYAVVEVENKDSWTWFLELLIEDLGGVDVASSCTFISDQQKGLLNAFRDLLPNVDQRYCVRHLYSNFRKQYPGKDLKRLMWSAATASYPELWESEMRKIKEVNLEAYKYLIAIPPRYWSRSRFTQSAHCDTLVNNMCEGFNSVLLHSRCKPIISMLEDIRVYIMKRWASNRNKMALYQGFVCPKVLNRFQKQSWLTRYWLPRWSSEQLFEVIHISQFGEQFVVNLDNKDCSCRGWFMNINAEQHIAHWFMKSAYEETYNSIIYPINGQHVWEITPYPDILPPQKRAMPGRPKKKRRLQAWELKKNDSELRKGGTKKTCAVCKELGHNKKTCPQRPMPSSHVPVDQPTQESTVTNVPADQPTQESIVLPSHE
ncbi:hypothetical protein V8G54_037493 [Vigna mungo]|uniref:Mutator-like transposase n=1 Tax=Vigna mungo TaxID=3915 RepID=A0AAQ3MKD8_VIGMU